MVQRISSAFLLLCAAPLLASASAAGAPGRKTEQLATQAPFSDSWRVIACSTPAPPESEDVFCLDHTATAVVPGLGSVALRFETIFDYRPNCAYLSVRNASITTRSRGKIELRVTQPRCEAREPLVRGTVPLAVSGGDGAFAGAAGTGTLTLTRYFAVQTGCCGRAEGRVALDLDAPNATFDVTPPVLRGAASKTVRAPKRARFIRVRYTVTAMDAVDGSVPVSCKPQSGSRFKVGATRVGCAATDSSGNTARRQFTVTVRRARR